MTRPTTLAGWLAYLETLHPKSIAMGLERVRDVASRLPLALAYPVITVTGTNGKGSTCAMLEAVLRCGGYRVGLYMSPHLERYNERVRIAGEIISDDDLLAAFDAVEAARIGGANDATPLTYFEFGTLAALWLFARAKLDVLVLEVGLGGRLDAVNLIDADVAVVTAVDLDHMDYLGPTREDIGREKAGIFRSGEPVVCGERNPPASLVDYADSIGARLLRIGRDFDFVAEGRQWRYRGPGGERYGLPVPALRGDYQFANASVALATLDVLRDRIPVTTGAIREGLVSVELPGRFQVLPGRPTIVLDVAHNPHAARVLAATLGAMGFHPETYAVFGMYADKDIGGVVDAVKARIDHWYVAGLPGARGAPALTIIEKLRAAGVAQTAIHAFDTITSAFRAARDAASNADRIIVFGSFLTVSAALAASRAVPETLSNI
ncbi:MAG: bifunctional tetrahydrofolate synthase/dihydrofolate synthase [Betaproteobacteria bacterium]|nr:MAG: bifunctional tetrahydrofolate synthase/dihydrofolate synthase [Betaproteobacteria bacterium]